jgi:hypothetical protein
MKGSEFAAVYGPKGYAAWENAAFEMAKSGGNVDWPFHDVEYTASNGWNVKVKVASDYFAIGDQDDCLRLPLTPITAQRIANLWGCFLPTPKLVVETWRSAKVKLPPTSMVPNKGANMQQFVEHNATIEQQLRGSGGNGLLRSGHKKDVVTGSGMTNGKVVIYGWMRSDCPSPTDPFPAQTAPWRVQPYSTVHDTYYFDYSHVIRFVAPECLIEGKKYDVEQVLTDARLAVALSDQGPLKTPRYPAPGGINKVAVDFSKGYAVLGLKTIWHEHV